MGNKLFFAFMIMALIFFAPGSILSAAAQNPQPDLRKAAVSGDGSGEYLLLFSIPQFGPEDAPGGTSPQETERYAARIVARQAEQLQPDLERFIARGQMSLVGVRIDRNGLVVQVKDTAILAQLAQLPGIQGVYLSAKSVTCSEQSARDLKLSLQAGSSAGAPELAPQIATISNPVINVYHHAGGDWGRISVVTTAQARISMRLLRGGAVVGSGSGIAYSDGTYTFYPSSGGCDDLSDWDLYDGDTVEVTANGSTVSTVVSPLEGWLDPGSNSLNGVTVGTSTVMIDLYTSNSDPCVVTKNTQSVVSNGAGGFSKSFTDFNRRAYATVWVKDINGNSTYATIHAYDIEVGVGWSSFDIHWKSNDPVTITLSRGGPVLYTWTWTTSMGYDYYYFTLPSGDYLQAGDIVALSSETGSMSYTAVPLSMSMNPATDLINGATSPGRTVVTRIYKTSYSGCNTTSGCLKTTANGSGIYSFSTALGVGDEVDVYTYDAEGNIQYGPWDVTPLLLAEPNYNDVGIRWPYSEDNLTVTLKDSANNVKETLTGISIDYSYYMIWAYFSSAMMVAGDRIEVTDGMISTSMTVSNLAARLNTSSAHLTGTSANGHLMARLYDYRYGAQYSQSYCQETNVASGSFNLAFSGSQIGPQDGASLYLTSPEGHYTYNYANAFTLNMYLGSSNVYGNTETPGAAVTAKLKRGGSTLATDSVTSDSGRWFYANFYPQATQAGDIIEVTTNEGSSATLTLPNLTMNMDGSGNRLYGIAPANAPLSVYFGMDTGYYNGSSTSGFTTADGVGNYSFSTAGLLNYNCQSVIPGGTCTYAFAKYSFPTKEHVLYAESYNDYAVSADSFESDDTYASASEFAGLQRHTIDEIDDVDWVKFNVLQSDVDAGVKFLLQTFNLGPGMDTVLELYAANGTTLLTRNDDGFAGSLASRIEWTPASPGTYYVKVLPFSSNNTRYCGAFYDLILLAQRAVIYIPQIQK